MKRNRHYLLLCTLWLTAAGANADVPSGYYDSLKGKSGEALKEAVKNVVRTMDFTRITYGESTWDAFRRTDVRIVDGMEVWWDMYSNALVSTEGHDGMNIEHSVANSWFGGKASLNPYSDLFHLNPSNSEANNQKKDLPLGEVATPTWQNELVKIGTPKAGTAGTATKVFEPADEYKGDFARAYLYIFTAYDDETWKTDQPMFSYDKTMVPEPWVVELLCRWATADPVDSKEIRRNEEIFQIQKNRNPFIDYPELTDYIWGVKKETPFNPGQTTNATDRPSEPAFPGRWITGVNTYSSRWWDSETVEISNEEGELWVSVNGDEYQQYGPGITIPSAAAHGEHIVLKAYAEALRDGLSLRSSTATLTLVGQDPLVADYTAAIYLPIISKEEFSQNPQGYHILQSVSNGHIMGHEGGTSSSSFMPDAGNGRMQYGEVRQLPDDAAVISFHPTEGGKYLLEVLDAMRNQSKGYWNVGGSGNKNTLKPSTGTAASVDFGNDGTVAISFEGGKSLQYNKTSPRFTNYSSSQGAVKLARFSEFYDYTASIEELPTEEEEGCIAIDGNNIYLPEGWNLYQLNGLRSDGRSLDPGIYIARSRNGKAVKILITR